MSKRNSTASNTLFNNFTKTPPSNKKPKQYSDETNNILNNSSNNVKVEEPHKSASASEEEVAISVMKRKRIRLNPIDSDDSDVENKEINNTISDYPCSLESSTRDLACSLDVIERLRLALTEARARNRELYSCMEQNQAEAREISRQYYEEQIQALRNENTQLTTDIAILKVKLKAERFARGRAEEEVQHLRACIDGVDVDNKLEKPKGEESMKKKLQESFKHEPNESPESDKTKRVVSQNVALSKKEEISPHVSPIIADEGNWTHCKLQWLKPENIRDAMKRRPDHPDYDKTTLFVPPEFMKQQTPAHKQWWDIKSMHFDSVLFFKVGKFYELYHMDAVVGVNELGFTYKKGEFAHSGFPKYTLPRMTSTLVSKGYKVVRAEQTETPEMMQERCKSSGLTSKTASVKGEGEGEVPEESITPLCKLSAEECAPSETSSRPIAPNSCGRCSMR